MPFNCYAGERICYLWVDKKNGNLIFGFSDGERLDHPLLQFEDRSRIKIMPFNAEEEISVEDLNAVLKTALAVYGRQSTWNF